MEHTGAKQLGVRVMAFVVALALTLSVAAILELSAPQQAHAKTKIALSKSKATVMQGKSLTLKLKGAKASKVKWSSSKKSVATVKNGKVKTKKGGTTTITAKYKGKKYKCKVTVVKLSMSKIGTQYFISKAEGGSYGQIVVKCYKHGKRCPDLKYYSSNKKIVKVDQDGWLEARGVGAATIKVKAHGATVKQKVIVRKNGFALKKIPTLYLGCYPEEEHDYVDAQCQVHGPIFMWCVESISSSNPSVATVDDEGTITPKQVGQTVITVKAHGQSASQTVVVKRPSISMDPIPDLYYGGEEGEVNAWCSVCESRYDNSTVYSSSNPSVVQVDRNGYLTPLKVGTATITARVHGATASRTVNVKLTPFTMSNSALTLSLERYEYEWDATSIGAECGICGYWCEKAKWKSSNPAVVEVDEYGDLVPKSKGTATITASAHGASATCLVTVVE
ncbi:Ig-like domain-containing protein [uncultured Adlercreutzia sp.]|uniref:Ig-like domain-containing protein n=1 Tax=uncultured Adlercreutzia sp. TaxID=875803 RepID=UPI0025D17D89|nr:Ig-like domain-containing protein [uncultured Adlercreutzia sp.]MCI9261500.1 hypothetical protein [Eggerthellaceae bacterium]